MEIFRFYDIFIIFHEHAEQVLLKIGLKNQQKQFWKAFWKAGDLKNVRPNMLLSGQL